MVQIVFTRADGLLTGVRSEGHAGGDAPSRLARFLFPKKDKATHGNILCAAVSALLYQLKVNLTMVEGWVPVRENEGSGFFELTLSLPDAAKASSYFKGLMIMLKRFELQYKNQIRIIMEDIHVT